MDDEKFEKIKIEAKKRAEGEERKSYSKYLRAAAKKRAKDEKDPKKQYEIFVIFAICILGYLILDGVFFNIFLD